MVSYKLEEKFPKDNIDDISFNNFFAWINERENQRLDKNIFTDPNSGLNSLLLRLNKNFNVYSDNPIRRYETLKLLYQLYDIQIIGNHLYKILQTPSYRSLDFPNEQFNTWQSDIFLILCKVAESGMEHQEKLNIEDIEEFNKEVPITQNKLINAFNAAIAMIKRVYSYKDGKYFTKKYCDSILDKIDSLKQIVTEYAQKDTFEYTTFELFYQVVNARQAVGANHSQRFIANNMLKFLGKDFHKISPETSIKYRYLSTCENIDNLAEYMKNNAEKLSVLVFDNYKTSVDNGKKRIISNAEEIERYYHVMQKETELPANSINLQALVALCRAFFVIEPNQNRPLLKNSFSNHGYYEKTEKNKRRNTFSLDVNNLNLNEGEVRKTACRMILEISNMYIRLYGGTLDILEERYILEIRIDDFEEYALLNLSYRDLNDFFDKDYYEVFLDAILTKDFLKDIQDDIKNSWRIELSVDKIKEDLLSDYYQPLEHGEKHIEKTLNDIVKVLA